MEQDVGKTIEQYTFWRVPYPRYVFSLGPASLSLRLCGPVTFIKRGLMKFTL